MMPKTLEDIKRESELVARAYKFAEKAHSGQKRLTGEPYFSHAKAAADMLASWNMDEYAVAAGLLHDIVEDTPVTNEDIEKAFGADVRYLVDGVTKLGTVKYRGDENQVQNLRKLVLAMAEDIRVVLIKIADRYHNMQTLSPLPAQKRQRIAMETMEIYAPIAYRLGMQRVSGELEDLAFPYVYPQEHKWLISRLKERYEEREEYLSRIKPIVDNKLAERGIKVISIDFRAKRYMSLYRKLLKNEMDVEKIHDLVAFRIIVGSIEDCYAALGVIHSLWPPLPGRIKDYIAVPKPNGYRSLHTSVMCVDGKIVEFQIRTKEMHDEAENGVAAHWAYEEHKDTKGYAKGRTSAADKAEAKWVERLRSWQNEFPDTVDFIESFKIDFLENSVLALTPKGEVIELPDNATPVDFAYHIHTDVGSQCVGAKVNGKIVPLNHKLKSTDVVEIITQKNKKPSASWLDFVVTSSARDHIKHALRESDRGRFFGNEKRRTELKITADDRVGLVKDVSGVISRSHINIVSIQSAPRAHGKFHVIKVVCDTDDKQKIWKTILKIKALKGIREIDYRSV